MCVDLACRAAGGLLEHDLPGGRASRRLASACASGRRRRSCSRPGSGPPGRAGAGDAADVAGLVDGAWPGAESPVGRRARRGRRSDARAAGRVGRVDPASIDDYRAAGGYEALRRAFEIGPAAVIREVTELGLVGRGGAAFPTGRKWDAVARQPAHPHHLVCNADESEPGTFKDRVLMEGDPFAVIEAMTSPPSPPAASTAGSTCAASTRGRRATLEAAIDAARRRGYLGDDVIGPGFAFDITIVRGAGAYICGEETAIFNSIEGYRGEPRNKPPFPVEVGLFGQPTVVNNVETLVNVLPILRDGGAAYAAIGTDGSTGRSCSACRARSPRRACTRSRSATTLGELIELAGGVRAGSRAAGRAARRRRRRRSSGPDDLDMPLTIEGARERGRDARLGRRAGARRLRRPRRPAAAHRRVLPRRVVRPVRAVPGRHRAPGGGARPPGRRVGADGDDLALLDDLAQVMRDASICGLGQTAPNAIQSAIETARGALTVTAPAP